MGGLDDMNEWGRADIYTEKVLWALCYRTRAATIATIMGCAGLASDIVIPVVERLVKEGKVTVYRNSGQPALYFLRGPRDLDMFKTQQLMQSLTWNLPIDDRVI